MRMSIKKSMERFLTFDLETPTESLHAANILPDFIIGVQIHKLSAKSIPILPCASFSLLLTSAYSFCGVMPFSE